ncbi:unnamed protein product, partial [Didymodactylos carnosus]
MEQLLECNNNMDDNDSLLQSAAQIYSKNQLLAITLLQTTNKDFSWRTLGDYYFKLNQHYYITLNCYLHQDDNEMQ